MELSGHNIILDQKWPIYPNQVFFWKTIKFNVASGSFYSAKLRKNLTVDPELWSQTIFRPWMTHSPQMRIFSEKPLI